MMVDRGSFYSSSPEELPAQAYACLYQSQSDPARAFALRLSDGLAATSCAWLRLVAGRPGARLALFKTHSAVTAMTDLNNGDIAFADESRSIRICSPRSGSCWELGKLGSRGIALASCEG